MSKSPFAERLQRLMLEKGLSQSDLAREVWGTMTDERGYTVARNRQMLTKYLTGKAEPRMSTVRKMSEALHVSLADLDPQSDPVNRPGSGVYVEPVDRRNARLQLNIVAPKTVIREVVKMLSEYTT